MSSEQFFKRSEQMAFDLLAKSADVFPLVFISQGGRIIVRSEDIKRVPIYDGDLRQYLVDSAADAATFAFLDRAPKTKAVEGKRFKVEVIDGGLTGQVTFFEIAQFGRRRKVLISYSRDHDGIRQGTRDIVTQEPAELWSKLSAAISTSAS